MNENQNNVQYYRNEIDLKELILALWKRKKMIISFTLVFAILAGLFSKFVISPVYDTKLNIVISMPEVYSTRYGDYTLPITTNDQYIKLITSNDVLINTIKDMEYDTVEISLEKLRKRIAIGNVDTKTNTIQNSFEVTVSADNPEESLKLAQTLFANYIEFIDVMTKERAINYFINNFSMNIKSLENKLKSTRDILSTNEELLAETPQIITKGEASIEIQTQLTDKSDYVVPVNTVNPNYIKIENDIVENKQSINIIENSIMMNNQYISELGVEKQALNKYYETGRAKKLESSVIGVVETSVYLPSPPVAPTQKTSPSNSLNTIIGAVIGGMIGVMTALIKEYWVKEA
ncbi:Wzz/FepE/Etk N-terminal domain-containing protein [Sedimentibacter saalensis]|uniref:LPS O-antigen subunit length determinant protein (WzzB/FepE family) n=1 Tax=Sedimentibacter saalensis TaxID=130788 RepID=A0A562J861_9FIRM|nr:Wzz/FepE/Etk N-terminal domain-containing protein [Sedimentibacter saalensis]TWH79366.1 LPS O-antigen subunit length determinant protein (WzzB/FepE family) [Sedimentibacter saalensis]